MKRLLGITALLVAAPIVGWFAGGFLAIMLVGLAHERYDAGHRP